MGFEPETLAVLKQSVARRTVYIQVLTGMMLYIYAYYSSDQSSKLSIPVVVHFATNVDIVSHNYNATLNYVRLCGK